MCWASPMCQSPHPEVYLLISLIHHNLASMGIADLVLRWGSCKFQRGDAWPIRGKDKIWIQSIVLCGLYFLKWENLISCNHVSSIHLPRRRKSFISQIVHFNKYSVLVITNVDYAASELITIAIKWLKLFQTPQTTILSCTWNLWSLKTMLPRGKILSQPS